MSFPDVGGEAVLVNEGALNLRRKVEFLRKRAVGSPLQRDEKTAAYTVADVDAGKHLTYNSASDVNWTLNADFPAGFWFRVTQLGAGRATFVAGTGATVNTRAATARTLDQYSVVWCDVISNTDGSSAIWNISGDVG